MASIIYYVWYMQSIIFDVIVVQCILWFVVLTTSHMLVLMCDAVPSSCLVCVCVYQDHVIPCEAKEAFRPICAVRSRIFVSNTAELMRRKLAVRAVLSLISVSWLMDDDDVLEVRERFDCECFLFRDRYKNILSKSICTGLSLSFVYVVFNLLRVTIVCYVFVWVVVVDSRV